MLVDTLQTLHNLPGPPGRDRLSYEVIVIDNDPACSARAAVAQLQQAWPADVPLSYVPESKPGLGNARNRGIEEARGEILAFLDDDLFVEPDWLWQLVACFEKTGADCVGGPAPVHWEDEPEPVVRDTGLASYSRGTEDRQFTGRVTPIGANLAFRRSVFAGGLRYSPNLGRIGNCLLSGEESEVIVRLMQAGKRIWYSAHAVVHHRTGGERTTAAYYLRREHWIGISYAIIDRNLKSRAYQAAHSVARLGKVLLVEWPRWLWGALTFRPALRLLARMEITRHLGYLRGALFGISVVPTPTPAAPPPVVPAPAAALTPSRPEVVFSTSEVRS